MKILMLKAHLAPYPIQWEVGILTGPESGLVQGSMDLQFEFRDWPQLDTIVSSFLFLIDNLGT